MKPRAVLFLVLSSCAGWSVLGCGGDSESGGSPISSGVDSDTPVNDLTIAEIEQVCEAVQQYTLQSELREQSCRLSGVLAAGVTQALGGDGVDACETAYEECMENEGDFDDCEDTEAPSEDCDSSVGQVEACFVAGIDTQEERLAEWNLPVCDDVVEWLEDNDEMIEEAMDEEDFDLLDLPECEALEPSCID